MAARCYSCKRGKVGHLGTTDCPQCGGSGWLKDVCGKCDGNGEITTTKYSLAKAIFRDLTDGGRGSSNSGSYEETKTCPQCKGSGKA